MSAGILDRARAFDMIAAHLSEEKRAEIAGAIGDRLLAEIKPAKTSASAEERAVVVEPDPEREKFEEAARFLADHGYSTGEQVRAAARLEAFLKRNPNLTREAGMRVWLGQERGGER